MFPARLARDFWVQPSETMIRTRCRCYCAGLDFSTDYLPWVVREFSGILCVDEVYQGDLALLLAADPAAPDGDRLVGYQLVQGTVDAAAVEAFLLPDYFHAWSWWRDTHWTVAWAPGTNRLATLHGGGLLVVWQVHEERLRLFYYAYPDPAV